MKLRSGITYLSLAAIAAAGCGGGSSGVGGGTATGTDFAFGELSGRAAVSNPPVSSASQAIMATGFTGTFSILKLRELNPGIQETRIVATSNQLGTGSSLVSYAVDGSDPVRITQAGGVDLFPSVAGNGKMVFERLFAAPPRATGTPQPVGKSFGNEPIITPSIQMISLDGSGLVQMAAAGFSPSIDYAGDKFAFIPDATHVGVMNVATKAITNIPLPTNTGIFSVELSPDGATVYTLIQNGTDTQLFALPANGSGTTPSLADFGTTTASHFAVAPDGSEVAVLEDGVPDQIVRIGTGGGNVAPAFPLPSAISSGLSYSADGKSFVVSTSDSGLVFGLYTVPLDGGSFNRLTPTTADTEEPCWTPFIKDRTLIAAGGGLLGTRACGVIQAQRAIGGTTGVVAFDVTTPSSVVMTAQPTSSISSDNLVFSVDADNIIKLAYANTTAWRGIRAIGSGTPVLSANGTLVSIDGITGAVVSILPFSGSRAAGSRPVVTDNGSMRTFTGTFLAVYDKNGKNLAPNGATTVKLDTKTGSLAVGG